jgi:hypothetical protein
MGQKPASVEVLPFDDPLDALRIVRILRIVDAVLHEQVILQGNEKTRAAGVALTSGAAPKLVVDAAALVPVCADHIQAAEGGHTVTQSDIRSAPSHIGGYRYGAAFSGSFHDRGFLLVIARVQHFVRDVIELTAEPFRFLDARGADQDRLAR